MNARRTITFKQWVVIGPNGEIISSAALRGGGPCFDTQKEAIWWARRFARWAYELKNNDDVPDWTWTQARAAGYRVKSGTFTVTP